jgi:hypothetical protein
MPPQYFPVVVIDPAPASGVPNAGLSGRVEYALDVTVCRAILKSKRLTVLKRCLIGCRIAPNKSSAR